MESGKWKGNEGFVAGLLAMLHSVRDNNHFRKRFQDAIVSLALSFQAYDTKKETVSLRFCIHYFWHLFITFASFWQNSVEVTKEENNCIPSWGRCHINLD